ncbi:MAG: hypothetical protein LUD72_05360 [Bacteroidales bacterium]|nr:hypothetical protein [Bacteroidales bacterium]
MPLNHRNIKPKIRKVRPLPNRKRMAIVSHMKEKERVETATPIEEKVVEAITDVKDTVEIKEAVEITKETAATEEQPITEDVVVETEEKPKKRGKKSKVNNGQTEISDDGTGTD